MITSKIRPNHNPLYLKASGRESIPIKMYALTYLQILKVDSYKNTNLKDLPVPIMTLIKFIRACSGVIDVAVRILSPKKFSFVIKGPPPCIDVIAVEVSENVPVLSIRCSRDEFC